MFVGNDHFTTPCTRDHLLPLKLEWKINKIKKRQNSKLFFFTVHIKGNPHNLLFCKGFTAFNATDNHSRGNSLRKPNGYK